MPEKVREIGYVDLSDLKDLTKKVFGKIFEGREKAKQRVVYDLLNYMKTNNRKQFLHQILRPLDSKVDDPDARKLSALINDIWVKEDTPENFEKMGYAIIMGIMSSGSGGEKE